MIIYARLNPNRCRPCRTSKTESCATFSPSVRRYGYEESHALQVADLAEKIFDALAPIYKLSRHGRTLLSAAALLHDVGYHISHESHHKHSHYLIKHSEMTGFSEIEKTVIANVARYHRGSLPKEKHFDFMQLGERERRDVARLGAILRLAEALDRGHENRITDIKFKRAKENLTLTLALRRRLPDRTPSRRAEKGFV
ncbi:MAG: HD domain-containing protein [Pyrinomonadaceae bacterium]